MDNKSIVRKFYEEIVNTGDVSKIPQVVGDDYTEVMDGKRYPVGVQGAASHILGVRSTTIGSKVQSVATIRAMRIQICETS